MRELVFPESCPKSTAEPSASSVLLLKLLPYEPICDFNSMATRSLRDGVRITKSQSLDERK